jgi:hypothetical protein
LGFAALDALRGGILAIGASSARPTEARLFTRAAPSDDRPALDRSYSSCVSFFLLLLVHIVFRSR